ncbi:MAG TPA: FAD-dependent oxidoreductase [Lentisphaeria bacterium]|nr:MAG: FAD-dependent oxidoreductase [Lentisphaerae bacterium GWF2_49_21]HBC85710.1 FAD-dependent oxidoreductase [Lentisphaeria bacterium]
MISMEKKGNSIREPERRLQVSGEYDVIVVGGGMAGFGAAMACARRKCRTLLIERESSLGGLATIGLVNIPLDFISGIGREMMDELKRIDGEWHRNSDPEKHKLVLDRMIISSGCDLLLVTHVAEVLVEKGRITGVVVESKSGRQAILAKRVIDCSGDADAAFFAGCECMKGRPEDGKHQACSLEFRLGGVDWDAYVNSDLKRDDPRWETTIRKALEYGELAYEVDNHLNWMTHVPGRPQHCGMDEVSICFAHSRNCLPLDNRDLTRMYLEGREQADMLWRFMRGRIPGFARSWLIDTATLLGVRETRRVVGEYIITAKDLCQWRNFDDVVCISGHGYDLHGPDSPGNIKWAKFEHEGKEIYGICHTGFGSTKMPPGGKDSLTDGFGRKGAEMKFPNPAYYDIPYRCLVPVGIDNILVAGRCLSSDFMAQSGCRLVLACLNLGEAAGIATAISLQQDIAPRKVGRIELQNEMIRSGCNIGQGFREIPGIDRSLVKKTVAA